MSLLLMLAAQTALQPAEPPAARILAPAFDPAGPAEVVDAEEVRHVGTVRLDIPDEIAPAMASYIACRFAARGIPVRWHGRDPTPPGVAPGSDCSPHREEAALASLRLLERRGGRSRAQREALVAAALANIDQFMARAPAPATR